MPVELYLVFVYGTLKINQPNHYWLNDHANGASRLIANGNTSEKYPMVIATRYNIPFLVNQTTIGNFINGEIYEVDEKMLGKLDELEGHPNYYLRQQITIDGNDGNDYVCWTYFLKKFPKDFLKDRQLISNYKDLPEASYVKPSDRPSSPKPIDDLDYRP
ncbi:putative gamma-glutamylcyclotransferase CG2811 [Sitodiplosis mosellana]|uniref:putative gamma-glutamylcyclotransferase CG2811 n=1 Tax=Sitodiplosis mosellana TaxID=263140 RepID=UPI00244495E9|nr:putative gamma-glutamylcyclotransferase CG2811 [Sitodiplosis mosellana]